MSPFQTFFNSGIKATGAGVGGVGIGEIRLRDPPGIVWESADKKKHWFGFDLVGWGEGGDEMGEDRGGVCGFGGQVVVFVVSE